MRRRTALLLALALALAWPVHPVLAAQAQSAPPARLALVIGNAAYSGAPLANTRADAALIAGALRRSGFSVTEANDLGRSAMFDAVRQFSAAVPAGATALVYYAGHGMQIGGNNYLVPVDMTPTSEAAVALRAFPLSALHERLALSRAAVNLVILDACRNNPFLPVPAVRMRSFGALGLGAAPAPRGTLVAYSTAPGQLAEDGSGRRHSIYSETLAGLIEQQGLPAERLFRTLADQVRRRTLEDQQPWYESSLVGDFYFRPPPGLQQAPAAMPAASAQPQTPGKRYRSGGSIGSEGDAAWYRNLDEQGWNKLDYELEQRAAQAGAAALAQLEAQAARGNVVAMTVLARAARQCPRGPAAPCSALPARARRWLQQAAGLGFAVAQTELGEMLYTGRGMPMDKAAARRWLELAAENRYPRARLDLAQFALEQGGNPAELGRAAESILRSLTLPAPAGGAQR